MKTLAIFSPAENAYSETFIQAHRNLPFKIKFYFKGYIPAALEGKSMIDLSFPERFQKKILKGFSRAEKKLLFSLKKEKVDMVLAEYGPAAAETLKVIKYLKLPLIVHFHGYDVSVKSVVQHYTSGYQKIFDYASSIIAVSEKMKQDLLQIGCPVEKLIVNYYGPNESFFTINPTFTNQQFLSIGRFVEKKAPYLTILAFKKVLEQFPRSNLVMIGDGSLLSACMDLVGSLGLDRHISFPGIQNVESIQKTMDLSMAFVQHSLTATDGDSEGTPVAVLEAQAAALPVISTYHAGIPDVVIHDKTGLLSTERDIDGMAANMIRILSEKGLAEQLGCEGRKRVKEHFTMKKHLEILANEIEKSLTRH